MDRIRKGRLYFELARNFLNCDLERAFRDQEWSTVVRRAQESTEFAIKAVWLICGEDPRKVHTPGIRKILSRVRPFIFGREDDLVLEKKPFIIRRDKTGDLILIKEDKGVHTELVRALPPFPAGPGVGRHGRSGPAPEPDPPYHRHQPAARSSDRPHRGDGSPLGLNGRGESHHTDPLQLLYKERARNLLNFGL